METQGSPIVKTIREELACTDVTTKTHRTSYPTVSPKRSQLSQAGRTILITGGGTGVGLACAKAFIEASASKVIIVGRRQHVLNGAAEELRSLARAQASSAHHVAEIIVRTCDLADLKAVEAFWTQLSQGGDRVDVLIHSAFRFSEPKKLLKLGSAELWSALETNVRGPMYFVEKFIAQNTSVQKFIVHVSSAQIHLYRHPMPAAQPGYTLNKTAQHAYFQLLAAEVSPNEVQIASLHPGLVHNDTWKSWGISKDELNDDSLPGGCAVYLASKEAEFLHGRMIWAEWDVDELKSGDLRKKIDHDEYFLRISLGGLRAGKLL